MKNSINQRFASSIVEKLLLNSGYMIYKLDYGEVLQKIINKKEIKDYDAYLKDIKAHNQDFMLLVNKIPYLIQIRFCEKPKLAKEIVNQGEVIFVTPKEPFFLVANTKEFLEEKKVMPLSKFLKIDKELLKEYKGIMKKRFK